MACLALPRDNGDSIDIKSKQGESDQVLDSIIESLLGQGIGYDEWKRQLQKRGGYSWSESLKNIIIKKEFSFFRQEILRLQAEPNKSRGLQSKTNSLESILKRLQGLEWGNGMPNEMEQRRRDGRLLGKDAKARCLQYHVSRWKNKDASTCKQSSRKPSVSREAFSKSAKTSASDRSTASQPNLEVNASFSSRSDVSSNCNSRRCSVPEMASLFGQTASVPASDPTLHGYAEIPFVPLQCSRDVETHRTDMSPDDVFRFIDHLNVPGGATNGEPSFELPRGDGFNDSYSTYIYEASRNPNTKMKLLEDILDSYGPPQDDNAMLWDPDWMSPVGKEDTGPSFMQQTSSEVSPSHEEVCISPQQLMHQDHESKTCPDNIRQNKQMNDTAHATDSWEQRLPEDIPAELIHMPQVQSESDIRATISPQTVVSRYGCNGHDSKRHRISQSRKSSHTDAHLVLRLKRQELAVAEAHVSALRNEIMELEASAEDVEELEVHSTLHSHKHKYSDQRPTRRIKRIKESPTGLGPPYGFSQVENISKTSMTSAIDIAGMSETAQTRVGDTRLPYTARSNNVVEPILMKSDLRNDCNTQVCARSARHSIGSSTLDFGFGNLEQQVAVS